MTIDSTNEQASIVDSLYSTANPAQNLVRDCADRGGHLPNIDALVALRADDDDLVAWEDVEAGDIHRQHVHRHRADHGRAATADQNGRASGEAQIQPVGI